MTALEVYEATLVELNKVNSPTFTVDQFNYFVNKTLRAFTNEKYSQYALSQQLSDDLRVLLSNYKVVLTENSIVIDTNQVVLDAFKEFANNSYTKVEVEDISAFRVGDIVRFKMTGNELESNRNRTITRILEEDNQFRFTPGILSTISPTLLTNPEDSEIVFVDTNFNVDSSLSNDTIYTFTIYVNNYYHLLSARSYWKAIHSSTGKTICDKNGNVKYKMYPVKRLTYDMLTNIETNAYLKPAYKRPYYMLEDNPKNTGVEHNDTGSSRYYQNRPIIRVHTGSPVKNISLEEVLINYLKLPETVILTDAEVYTNLEDTSQILEYPESVKNDLVKKLVGYFLENVSNPRVQTFEAFNPDHRVPQKVIAEG